MRPGVAPLIQLYSVVSRILCFSYNFANSSSFAFKIYYILNIEPKYLLYDEPTTGLDPITTENINFLIKKIHNRGNVTSIMVTHELRTVYYVADRVIMLDKNVHENERELYQLLCEQWDRNIEI